MSAAKSLDPMPEAFVSDKSVTRAVSRAVKAGKLRKLASRLYSRNMVDPPRAGESAQRLVVVDRRFSAESVISESVSINSRKLRHARLR